MTPAEINEAVARKLFWKPIGINHWRHPDGVSGFRKPPDYCRSIAAAWEIVEKIEWFCLEKSHSDGNWSVWDMAGTEEAVMICEADTAPLAICLAFLKLKGD